MSEIKAVKMYKNLKWIMSSRNNLVVVSSSWQPTEEQRPSLWGVHLSLTSKGPICFMPFWKNGPTWNEITFPNLWYRRVLSKISLTFMLPGISKKKKKDYWMVQAKAIRTNWNLPKLGGYHLPLWKTMALTVENKPKTYT